MKTEKILFRDTDGVIQRLIQGLKAKRIDKMIKKCIYSVCGYEDWNVS